jgi:hypothetical protein
VAVFIRRRIVQRFLLVAVVVLGLGLCGWTATAQQTGNTQNSGSGQQAPPAQKPDAAQPAAPAQNEAPAQEPAPVATTGEGIAGKWHFVLDTEGGDREADADLVVGPDGKVTGKFGNSEVAGTYKDGKFDLDFPFTSDELGQTAELKFNGKLDQTSELTGTWEFITYSGTFKATRLKA